MIATLQHALARHADPDKRAWWERYLRGAAAFRGVPMDAVRREVGRWLDHGGPDTDPARVEAALLLLAEPMTEDKLAGMLLLCEHVLPAGRVGSADLFPQLARALDAGHLADWNSVDWLSVKVLAGWLQAEGLACADRLLTWQEAPVMWRRRAALVAFVPLAPKADDALADRILTLARVNVQDPARFSQTSVGWTLRELSRAHPERVRAFLDTWGPTMSSEARKAAGKHL